MEQTRSARGPAGACGQASRRRLLALLAGTTLGLATALGGHVSNGRRAGGIVLAAGPAACDSPPHEPAPFAPPDGRTGWQAPSGALVTTIQASGGQYRYAVGGQPETIRGMGYSPVLDGLSPDVRRQRLDRDLALMAAAGVNTLIGWDPAVLDGLALDVAWQVGLGVALPFDVDFTADLSSPAVRRGFLDTIRAWVEQYHLHPALRLWAVGNEVLQRTVPPSWCASPPTVEQAAWAEAWSRLLLEAADLIHDLDPAHPVLYREAEDAYAPWLARALAKRPADRSWLVYGVNAYTPRLADIVEAWPARGIPTSLLISEFAPLNASRGERSAGFREQWAAIRAHPEYVLGGAVYVWSTDGPEAVDRQFGLVDGAGQPVDDALEAVATLYHDDARERAARAPTVAAAEGAAS
ncbi:MAG: hypothetical protein IT306_19700 [Chloroflexi bacterium]|nr:hypothetical protein [Chloroflexota bacterium]